MTLRTRLLLGFSVLVGALVALGGSSAWHLWQMSALLERIVAENYDSVVAARNMKESLERQDSAALFVLLGRVGQRYSTNTGASAALRFGVSARGRQCDRAR